MPDKCKEDEDRGGVIDDCDPCLVTPSGVLTDTNGCPLPVWACRVPEGICIDETDSDNCGWVDGSHLGDGLGCGGNPDGDSVSGCDDGCPTDANKTEPVAALFAQNASLEISTAAAWSTCLTSRRFIKLSPRRRLVSSLSTTSQIVQPQSDVQPVWILLTTARRPLLDAIEPNPVITGFLLRIPRLHATKRDCLQGLAIGADVW